MSRIVCCIDKNTGQAIVCGKESAGITDIDCSTCAFREKYEGKEAEEFIWCRWKGDVMKDE